MPAKGTKRDPLLDCPIVKIYREVVHLQMNYLQRKYVAENVSCCERGQYLWRATLEEFMLKGMNPKNIPYMVKIWGNQYYTDSAQFEAFQPNTNGGHK